MADMRESTMYAEKEGRQAYIDTLNQFFDASVDLFVISSGDGYFKRVSRSITDRLTLPL